MEEVVTVSGCKVYYVDGLVDVIKPAYSLHPRLKPGWTVWGDRRVSYPSNDRQDAIEYGIVSCLEFDVAYLTNLFNYAKDNTQKS